MPKVPTLDAPTVAPAGPAIPYYSGRGITPDAFGMGVGQAISQTGDMLEKHALALQQRVNQANATDAYVNGTEKLGELNANFMQLRGKAALDAMPKYIEDVKKVHQDFRGTLTTMDAQHQFDQDFKRRMGYDIESASRHSATQMRGYETGAQKAREGLAYQTAATAQDDKQFALALEDMGKTIASQSKQDSWSPEQLKLETETRTSNMWKLRLKYMALTDPFRAKDLFEKNKDQIQGVDRLETEKEVNTGIVNAGSRVDAEKIWNKTDNDWGGKLQERGNIRTQGMNPTFGARLARGIEAAEEATGEKIRLESGVRTTAEQADIYRRYQEGKVALAAPPGTSRHEVGEAADIASGKGLQWLRQHAAEYGLEFLKDPKDPGHVQLLRGSAQADTGTAVDVTDIGPNRLEKAQQEAAKRAKEVFPNDPVYQQQYEDQLLTKLNTKYALDKKVQREQQLTRYATVATDLNMRPDGNPGARSFEELSVQGKTAYNNSPEPTRKRYDAWMLANAKADQRETPAKHQRYLELLGLATTDPDKFADTIIGSESIAPKRVDELTKIQLSNQRKLRDTSHIMSALRTLGPTLNDAGIYSSHTDTDANSKYNQFAGALEGRLRQFEEEKKRFPNEEEIKKMGADLLAPAEGTGYFGSNVGAATRYETVPKEHREAITKEFQKRNNRAPTEAEIRYYYNLKNQ